jgi:cell division transport system permease protein
MVTASIKDDLRSFRRSWVHHTGMQLATLTVLVATFTVVGFILSLSMNLKRVITAWGDGIQIAVYLSEDVGDKQTSTLEKQLAQMSGVSSVTFVSREKATDHFKSQMASYAPDLLSDAEFSHPFPASFQVSLKGGVQQSEDLKRLEELVAEISHLDGVEDVSYGQSWVKNYSAFVTALSASGGIVALILLAGGIFVVGNSIRASIASRREEIEILELVGATQSMIRRPYIAEGAMMGALAAVVALSMNFGLHLWQVSVMKSTLAFARIAEQFVFLDTASVCVLLACGAVLGGMGAWLTVRRINDGWAASQRFEG